MDERELGAALRRARENKGIELEEANRVLKIRLAYLRAMEEDRWERLPERAYARSFLQTYARYLGADEVALLARFDSGPGASGEIDPLPAEMLPRRGQLKRRRMRLPRISLAAAALAALVAVMLFGYLSTTGGDEETPGAPSAAEREADEGGAGEPATDGSGGGGAAVEDEPAPQPEPESDRIRLKLVATGDVWTCLESGGGELLVPGETLLAGDERGPFESRRFRLGAGNGAIEIRVDGERLKVPDSADPVGYAIDASGSRALEEGSRPDCV